MTILNAIQSNVNPQSKMMQMISITKTGDGTSVFNKTNGKRKATEKVLMEATEKEGGIGYSAESIISETKNTFLIGSNYQTLQNNRIKKAITTILDAVDDAGGDATAELILNGVKEKASDGTAFESKSLPWGEWVHGWEGILIKHNDNFYLRVYNETCGKGNTTFFDPNGEELDIDAVKFSKFRKAEKKASGKVNELKEALGKVLDLDNVEIKEALQSMKSIRPETMKIDNIKELVINKQRFEK